MAAAGNARGKDTGLHVALLRGVNVGGRRLPMKDLAAMFVAEGCTDVRTYIQSGNVVFRARPTLVRRIPSVIGKAIVNRFGFDSPIILRAAADLRRVATHNPFLAIGADPTRLHVAFLADVPARSRMAALEPERWRPDEFVVRGGEIYLHYPRGMGLSKLTNMYFDARLGTVSTVRNWRTVLALLDLTSG